MAAWFRQFTFKVSNLDATIKFYEMLGFECTGRYRPSANMEGAMIENPERGGWLLIYQDDQPTPIDVGNGFLRTYIYTDDCQGLYDKCMAAGFESITPPTRMGKYPTTAAFVKGPDGYVVEFVQRDEPPVAGGPGGTARDQVV